MRADALNTVWRQFGLLLGNEIRQSLSYFGIWEDPLAALTGESPTCHCQIVATGKGRENTQVRVPFCLFVTGRSSRDPIAVAYSVIPWV